MLRFDYHWPKSCTDSRKRLQLISLWHETKQICGCIQWENEWPFLEQKYHLLFGHIVSCNIDYSLEGRSLGRRLWLCLGIRIQLQDELCLVDSLGLGFIDRFNLSILGHSSMLLNCTINVCFRLWGRFKWATCPKNFSPNRWWQTGELEAEISVH